VRKLAAVATVFVVLACRPVTPEAERIALVRESMRDFAVAVNARSMAEFRESVSRKWRDELDVAGFEEAYSPVYGQIDLTILDPMEPILETGAVGEDGQLQLTGYYPTRSMRVTFALSYVREGEEWKLSGLGINTVPVGAQ
jgi:hypothetical protein